MTVAAGIYGNLLYEAFIGTLSGSLDSETLVKGALVTDTHTPDFDADQDVADLDNELTDGDYARAVLTTTDLDVGVAVAGTFRFDAVDTSYGSTVTIGVTPGAAMGHAIHLNTGVDSTSELIVMQDFGTGASSSNGSFTVAHHTDGIFRVDYTP